MPPGGQKPAKRKRDSSQASSSVSSLPDTPVEITADQSLDNSEGKNMTVITGSCYFQTDLSEPIVPVKI